MEKTEISNEFKKVENTVSKVCEPTEEDAIAQRHELFLREIEAIDEYWGPTFRQVETAENVNRKLDQVQAYVKF